MGITIAAIARRRECHVRAIGPCRAPLGHRPGRARRRTAIATCDCVHAIRRIRALFVFPGRVMPRSLGYVAFPRVPSCIVLQFRSCEFKALELVALGDELAVLRHRPFGNNRRIISADGYTGYADGQATRWARRSAARIPLAA